MKIINPSTAHIPVLRELWKEAFGDSDIFLDNFFSVAFHTKRCRIAINNGEIAAALYWFDCSFSEEPMAYLYAVATAKKYRGQGICHTLMKDTHNHLAGHGYQGALLVPGGKELFLFYESLRYKTCCYVNTISCLAAKTGAPLRQITKKEYATLRRSYLPVGSVIQENESIDFLETQAQLYVGNGFLLAARSEGNLLRGIELLGTTNHVAEITAALGCSRGLFRTPGEAVPFAMYYPLQDNRSFSPTYFGLAFD